jgi:hypothetical protein
MPAGHPPLLFSPVFIHRRSTDSSHPVSLIFLSCCCRRFVSRQFNNDNDSGNTIMKKLIALSTTLAIALLMTTCAFAQQNAASSTSPRIRVAARTITVVRTNGSAISSSNGATTWQPTQNLAELQHRSERMEQLKMMAQSTRRDSGDQITPMPTLLQPMEAATACQYINRHQCRTMIGTTPTAGGF